MAVNVTVVFSSDHPFMNKLAMEALNEVNDMLVDGNLEEATTKLGEFLDFVDVLDAKEGDVVA